MSKFDASLINQITFDVNVSYLHDTHDIKQVTLGEGPPTPDSVPLPQEGCVFVLRCELIWLLNEG